MIERQTLLSSHMIQFCRYLRSNKFECGISEERELLTTLANYIPIDRIEFHSFLKSILVKNKDQYFKFDKLFKIYWKEIERAQDSKIKEKEEEREIKEKPPKPRSIKELKDWLYNGRISDEEELAAFSPAQALMDKDFSTFDSHEINDLLEVVKVLAKKLSLKNHYRYQSTRKPKSIDLRKSLSLNMRKSDGIDYLAFKKKKQTKLKITLLCDVSKSMDLYSRFILQFMYSFHQISAVVENFVFSTSLSHISPVLKNNDFGLMLEQLSSEVTEWSGGTNIGHALAQFQNDYGGKYLDRKTIVVIVSDGWDQGDSSSIELGMNFLKKNAAKLIWLNPLASNPTYKPSTIGMKAAMPYIDILQSAHNLNSLVELVKALR